MQLLKDLLSVSTVKQQTDQKEIIEAKASDFGEMLQTYMDQQKMYNFEGSRGVRNLKEITRAIGYSSLDAFLEDNSGAIEAIVNWLTDLNIPEFAEKIEPLISEE